MLLRSNILYAETVKALADIFKIVRFKGGLAYMFYAHAKRIRTV